MNNGMTPKRGSVADYKAERKFINRTMTIGSAITEGLFFVVMFAFIVIACAVA